MTNQQQQALNLAVSLGVDPKEVEMAIQLMRTGRADLIVAVTARRMSVRAALKTAKSTNLSPRVLSRAR